MLRAAHNAMRVAFFMHFPIYTEPQPCPISKITCHVATLKIVIKQFPEEKQCFIRNKNRSPYRLIVNQWRAALRHRWRHKRTDSKNMSCSFRYLSLELPLPTESAKWPNCDSHLVCRWSIFFTEFRSVSPECWSGCSWFCWVIPTRYLWKQPEYINSIFMFDGYGR